MISELEKIRAVTESIFKAGDVEYAGVFGSFARGEEKETSDIDFLVKFKGRPTFAGYLNLNEALRKSLNREIDLVTVGAVNKFLKPQIEKDLQVIYGQR